MTTWINYAETGYDESDGLLGGRWMFDDERRCQVWVVIKPQVVGRVCEVCEIRPAGVRAACCQTCRQRVRRANLRAAA